MPGEQEELRDGSGYYAGDAGVSRRSVQRVTTFVLHTGVEANTWASVHDADVALSQIDGIPVEERPTIGETK